MLRARSDKAQWNSMAFVTAVAASVADAVADSVFSIADLTDYLIECSLFRSYN